MKHRSPTEPTQTQEAVDMEQEVEQEEEELGAMEPVPPPCIEEESINAAKCRNEVIAHILSHIDSSTTLTCQNLEIHTNTLTALIYIYFLLLKHFP